MDKAPGVVVDVVIAAQGGHGPAASVIVEAPAVSPAQDRSLAAFADGEVSRVRRPDVCAGRGSWPRPP